MSTVEKQCSFSPDSSATVTDPFKVPHKLPAGLSVDERALSLFQPDVLLPSQYLATTQRKFPSQPEKKLMLAILEDAVVSFQKFLFAQNGRRKTLFREAEEWLFQDNGQWVFCFETICDALGFNADYLRKGLIEWKQRELAKQHKALIYSLRPDGKPKSRPGRACGAKKQKYLKVAGC